MERMTKRAWLELAAFLALGLGLLLVSLPEGTRIGPMALFTVVAAAGQFLAQRYRARRGREDANPPP